MTRRTLLRWIASAAAAWPLVRLHVHAQGAELTPAQILALRDIASTVLPSVLGPGGIDQAVDAFLRWLRDYRAGVPLSHGYGHPVLVFTGPSPAGTYARQLDALAEAARARGRRFGALPLEARRGLLDDALAAAGVRSLPNRPSGAHVVSDLMAHYFRSSAAWDLCYDARIGRHTFRPIAVTTVRPQPLSG